MPRLVKPKWQVARGSFAHDGDTLHWKLNAIGAVQPEMPTAPTAWPCFYLKAEQTVTDVPGQVVERLGDAASSAAQRLLARWGLDGRGRREADELEQRAADLHTAKTC